jgi:hypothetical protein
MNSKKVILSGLAISLLPILIGCGDSTSTGGLGDTQDAGAGGSISTGTSCDGGSSGGGNGGKGGMGGATEPFCTARLDDVQSGSSLDDRVTAMTRDGSDHLYVVGFEQGLTGVTNIEPTGDSRGFLEKREPDGTLIWRRTFETAGTDTIENVVVDALHDRVLVVGRTSGAFTGFTNAGQFDLFIAALDPHGQVLDLLQVGTDRPQHPAVLTILTNGDVAVGGYDDIYIPSNYVAAWEDAFLVRFTVDSMNEIHLHSWWQSGTESSDFITGVAPTSDGSDDMFVAGMATGGSSRGLFAMRLQQGGRVVWRKNISPLTLDWLTGMALSPTGEPIVTGSTFLTLGAQSFGQQDAFVLKLAPETGEVIWALQAGSAASDWVTAIATDATGITHIAGSSPGSVVPGQSASGMEEPFVLSVDSSGALIGAWQANTTAFESITSLSPNLCGNVVIGGFVEGDLGGPSVGGQDEFLHEITP